ncbi:MAG: AAA domain-containing protein [Breznakibacter sp.]
MAEFTRSFTTSNFEGISDEILNVVLKFKDDYTGTWERNESNSLKFEQVKRFLTSEPRLCFFQKAKNDEKNNKSRHKIIIPIDEEKTVELIGTLFSFHLDQFTEKYAYLIIKAKEAVYINEPIQDTKKVNCKISVSTTSDKTGTNDRQFIEFFQEVDNLNVPTLDLNKEKDKEIWKKYVEALKELIKQKVQLWKIQKIDNPKVDRLEGSKDRANFIDIYIDEKDVNKQFEKDIEEAFLDEELEDYRVSEDRAFIEFSTYRESNQEELDLIKEMAANYFFDIADNSPQHYISGEINFKYSDINSKDKIISQLKEKLMSDYQIEIIVDENGCLDVPENDLPHIKKVISDNFDFILDLIQDNNISLKVEVEKSEITTQLINQINSKLQSQIPAKANTTLLNKKEQIAIEVSANIFPDFLKEFGLIQKERVSRFGNFNNRRSYIEIEGISLIDNEYQLTNITSKPENQKILEKIQNANEDLSIRQLPTRYIFEINKAKDIERLKNFKTETDLKGKTNFDILKSTITITTNNNSEYKAEILRIKKSFPNAVLEDKAFKPNYFLQFKTDLENQRQSIVNKIQNEIRKGSFGKIKFDPYKQFSRVAFEYFFNDEEKRENFMSLITSLCEPYEKVLNYSFENKLGRTIFEFYKNEKLEFENEKKIYRNIKSETFVFATKAQRHLLELDNVQVDSFADDIWMLDDDERQEYFDERNKQKQQLIEQRQKKRETQKAIDYAQQIGTLVRKQGNRFTFRINDRFDNLISGTAENRLKFDELIGGFIKPIFPGELTNIDRMIKAMSKVTEPGKVVKTPDGKRVLFQVGYPANKNLCNFLFDPKTARQSTEDIEEEKKRISSNLNEPLLKNQPKQLEAVAKSLLAKDVALIQGPPGTGKTTVIAEIIWQTLLIEPEAKILITSQTNLAVDNALERLKGKKLVRPIRIGNIDKFEDEGKVYSDKRLKDWRMAKPNSNEEKMNADNAICVWVQNVIKKCSDNPEYQNAITKWKKGLNDKESMIKETFATEYLKNVNVFAATCSECGSRNFGETYQSMFQKNKETQGEPEFDLVIMDEASKATPPELVLPLTLGKKVIIIGDHKQLPPMIDENEFSEALEAVGANQLVEDWTKDDYKISQFEKLFIHAPKNFVTSLDTQFRMHEDIMNCISQFYKDQEELENGLICGIRNEMNIPDLSVKASRYHGLNIPPFLLPDKHAIWVNVETPELKIGNSTSFSNEGEVKAIKSVLNKLTHAEGFEQYFNSLTKEEDKEIGIITYYMGQMKKIQEAIYPNFTPNEWRNFEQHKYKNEFQLPFRINTVDRFQGMERNIIIISTVRSNKQKQLDTNGKLLKEQKNEHYPYALGFAREIQRVNVGFSRAKRLLIVIGNEKHFSNRPEYLEAIQKMHRVDIAQLQNL